MSSPLLAKFFTSNYFRVLKKAESSGFISLGEIVSVIKVGVARNPTELAQATALMGANLQLLGVTLLKQGLAEKVGQNKTHHEKKRGQSRIEKVLSEIEEDTNDIILKIYFKDVGRFDLLTPEEIYRICEERKGGRALESRNRIAEHNLRFVIVRARDFRGRGLEYLDLIQEGSLGLITAARKFNHLLGFKFSTYAYHGVTQAIQRGIDTQSEDIQIPINTLEINRRVLKTSGELASRLGRRPTTGEIATETGLDIKVVDDALQRLKMRYVYFDDLLDPESGGGSSYSEVIADHKTASPEVLLEAREELERTCWQIREFLGRVKIIGTDQRQLEIFKMRYGLDDSTFNLKTLAVIGKKFSITRERVRQIIEKVWEKLERLGFKGGDQWLSKEFDKLFELENLTGEIVDLHSFKNASD